MKLPKSVYCFSFILSFLIYSCSAQRTTGLGTSSAESLVVEKNNNKTAHLTFIDPARSFRAVWVATVANIDWPKKPNDSFEKMQKDYLGLLEFYKKMRFNAVIVQIRAAGDAFYPTHLAPWSKYLTGKQGENSKFNIDPLEWLIETTHKYGMDFHAWINPYRATMTKDTSLLSESHDFYKHPEWMVPYGSKYYYNPGLPEVQQHLITIVQDITKRYNIDGIHLDDYFYPYKIEGALFKDQKAFAQYGNGQAIDDWRRENINNLIKEIHNTVKSEKPWVSFGVSPFGVWKNNHTDPRGSNTRAGQTTFDDLYADPLVWMEKGWIDYLAPQLYWSMDFAPAAHKTLVDWWANEKKKSNIYIGYGAYKIYNNSDPAWANPNEIIDQLTYGSKHSEITGQIIFSAKSLMQPGLQEIVTLLKKGPFKHWVLPPLSLLSSSNEGYPLEATIYEVSQEYFKVNLSDPNLTKLVLYSTNANNNLAEVLSIIPVHKGLAHIKNSKVTFIKGVNRNNELSEAFSIDK